MNTQEFHAVLLGSHLMIFDSGAVGRRWVITHTINISQH
jgi:hypothetical protein